MSSSSNDVTASSSETLTPSPVPLLDLHRENGPLRAEILAAIADVFDSGQFVLGPPVRQLEQAVAQFCQTSHAIGCASGSDALLLALMAAEIGPGDEVIVPSFTFFATASAVSRLGAVPRFVDIEPASFNIDLDAIEKAISPATKAIVPVHLFGQCADMKAINEIAQRHKLFVVEDAAQAIGAKLGDKPAGSLGEVGCFSFYPTKNLGGIGDAGMLTTSDDTLADKLRMLSAHGMRPRYYHGLVGINSRLDSIQAAALLIKLNRLAGWTNQRRANAARYEQLFAAAGPQSMLTLPTAARDYHHVWNQYTIRVPARLRSNLREQLREAGVGSEIYYPVPLHQQECFRSLDYEAGSLPETERAADEVLSLPVFPGITEEEQCRVVDCVATGLRKLRRAA